MNKRKIAIFVEGDTELVFVRHFLNTWYNYDSNRLGVECYKLQSNSKNSVPYPIGSRNSENFYEIIIVGNDNSVISKMLARAEELGNAGFSSIIGLRDMFCDLYHQASTHGRVISTLLNDKFIHAAQNVIDQSKLSNKKDIHLYFAIMEVEAWLLGLNRLPIMIDSTLEATEIKEKLGIDLSQDPEKSIYHPAVVLKKIFELSERSYDKHTADAEKILSQLNREDFEQLYRSGKCQSFQLFVDAVV